MTNIDTLVEQQFELLLGLKGIIEQEKLALEEQNADILLSLAGKKAEYLSNLQRNDQALASHPDGQLLTSTPTLAEKVQQAKEQLKECQSLNAQNAQLIELNLASINRFSQALQASRKSSNMTYDGKGQTSSFATLGNDIKA